jgi:hypothetical protein
MVAVSMKAPQKKMLKPSLRRLISLLALLEQEGYEATMEGFAKILVGVQDEETAPLVACRAFGALPSLGKKRLKMRCHELIRHGYLALAYSEEDQDYYLRLNAKSRPLVDLSSLPKKKAGKPLRKRTIRPL